VQAVTNLPHKAFVYGALIGMVNLTCPSLAHDIVSSLIEHLQHSLVTLRDIASSKNLVRVLAVLCELGTLASGWLSQAVLQLIDECVTGAGGKVGKAEQEIVLEAIMAGLMIAAQRMQKEQTLDYGSILEGIKKVFAQRDVRGALKAQALAPVKKPATKDLLTQLWEGFCTFTDSASVKKDFLLFSYSQSYQRISD
jgi:hypothetical protein